MDDIPMMATTETTETTDTLETTIVNNVSFSGLTHAEEVRARALELTVNNLRDNWLTKDKFYARAREFEKFILGEEP